MRTLLFSALLLLLPSCTKKPHFTEADVAERIFRDSKHLEAMASATAVTAYRLHPKAERDASIDSLLASYVRGEPVPLSSQQANMIKRLLKNPASYELDALSMCLPDYGVLLMFKTEPHDIGIALCFKCHQVAVFEQDRRLNQEADIMAPMRPQLVSLAKTLFPADPEIRGLE